MARIAAFVAWLAACFALVTVILINVAGVSLKHVGPYPRIANLGLELVSWQLEGQGDISIANYYHYRVYNNRVCAVQRAQTRGEGFCQSGYGVPGAVRLSTIPPDSYVARSQPYAFVPAIDLLPALAGYVLAAPGIAIALIVLPSDFLCARGGGGVFRSKGWLMPGLISCAWAAAFLIIASVDVTVQSDWLYNRLQNVPEVTRTWRHAAPLALTWTAAGLMVFGSGALAIVAVLERRGRGCWSVEKQR